MMSKILIFVNTSPMVNKLFKISIHFINYSILDFEILVFYCNIILEWLILKLRI